MVTSTLGSRYVIDAMQPITNAEACPFGTSGGIWRSDGLLWVPTLPHPCGLFWETLCFDCVDPSSKARNGRKVPLQVEAQQSLLHGRQILFLSTDLAQQILSKNLVQNFCEIHRQRHVLHIADGMICAGEGMEEISLLSFPVNSHSLSEIKRTLQAVGDAVFSNSSSHLESNRVNTFIVFLVKESEAHSTDAVISQLQGQLTAEQAAAHVVYTVADGIPSCIAAWEIPKQLQDQQGQVKHEDGGSVQRFISGTGTNYPVVRKIRFTAMGCPPQTSWNKLSKGAPNRGTSLPLLQFLNMAMNVLLHELKKQQNSY